MQRMKPERWNSIWGHQFSRDEHLLVKHFPDIGPTIGGSSNSSEEDNNNCCLSLLTPQYHNFSHLYPIQPYQTYRFPFYKKNEQLFITSCKGLVCLDNYHGRLVICNFHMQCLKPLPLPHRRNLNHQLNLADLMPLARHLSHGVRYGDRLPSFRLFVGTGFGFDYATDDYKVVRIISYTYECRPPREYISYEVEEKIVVEIYSLRDECWREIECPDFVAKESISYYSSVHVAGTYYWFAGLLTHRLLSFNFATEEFSTLALPTPDNDLSPHHLYSVFELEGSGLVAVGYNHYRTLPNDLFVFWEREGDTWNPMMKITVDKCIRPMLLKPKIFFFERKAENEDLSEVVAVHVSPKQKVYGKQLGYIDRRKYLKLVSYDSSTYCPPNAEYMTGSFTIEEASDDDEDPDNFNGDE